MSAKTEATIEDLYRVPEHGKAEIVNGEVVLMSPTGQKPSRASFKISLRLYEYELSTGSGIAVSDNAAFKVNLPNRKSFSPDAAFFVGQHPGMKFFDCAPVFAAEVRSENDYGPPAEREIKEKISDYFAAGTLVVWDVDLLSEDVVRVYRIDSPDQPSIYRRGEMATAEPALSGWAMAVDDLFQ
jgi:Uma2 family endonuclease